MCHTNPITNFSIQTLRRAPPPPHSSPYLHSPASPASSGYAPKTQPSAHPLVKPVEVSSAVALSTTIPRQLQCARRYSLAIPFVAEPNTRVGVSHLSLDLGADVHAAQDGQPIACAVEARTQPAPRRKPRGGRINSKYDVREQAGFKLSKCATPYVRLLSYSVYATDCDPVQIEETGKIQVQVQVTGTCFVHEVIDCKKWGEEQMIAFRFASVSWSANASLFDSGLRRRRWP
jgi:hypothetical protein